ncbi:hypothetical protein C8R44DRAFT_734710 [Mycena epipterygia]|nr:hypothetical protein C8R44DRAFT_734710 [Mycena epipterygia]
MLVRRKDIDIDRATWIRAVAAPPQENAGVIILCTSQAANTRFIIQNTFPSSNPGGLCERVVLYRKAVSQNNSTRTYSVSSVQTSPDSAQDIDLRANPAEIRGRFRGERRNEMELIKQCQNVLRRSKAEVGRREAVQSGAVAPLDIKAKHRTCVPPFVFVILPRAATRGPDAANLDTRIHSSGFLSAAKSS